MCKLTVLSFVTASFLTLGFRLHQDHLLFHLRASAPVGALTPQAIAPTYSSLRATVFSRCVECHSSNGIGPADFSTYENLIRSGKLVPGSAHSSKIFLETAAMRMPLHGTPLNRGELYALQKWIDSGALNN